MDVVTKRSILLPVVSLRGNVLREVSEIVLLGVTFSSDLKWNKHFDVVVRKASRRFYLLYNLVRAKCPTNLLVCSYIAYIRSLLLYSFPTFCNAPEYLNTY